MALHKCGMTYRATPRFSTFALVSQTDQGVAWLLRRGMLTRREKFERRFMVQYSSVKYFFLLFAPFSTRRYANASLAVR
ncbi:MAG: hypothetical protein KME40_23390 [Komarekiella atlantica HA4396-MV6]|nr:hypothetical protein [Komarekiella atlantica HA4396-MV6]